MIIIMLFYYFYLRDNVARDCGSTSLVGFPAHIHHPFLPVSRLCLAIKIFFRSWSLTETVATGRFLGLMPDDPSCVGQPNCMMAIGWAWSSRAGVAIRAVCLPISSFSSLSMRSFAWTIPCARLLL